MMKTSMTMMTMTKKKTDASSLPCRRSRSSSSSSNVVDHDDHDEKDDDDDEDEDEDDENKERIRFDRNDGRVKRCRMHRRQRRCMMRHERRQRQKRQHPFDPRLVLESSVASTTKRKTKTSGVLSPSWSTIQLLSLSSLLSSLFWSLSSLLLGGDGGGIPVCRAFVVPSARDHRMTFPTPLGGGVVGAGGRHQPWSSSSSWSWSWSWSSPITSSSSSQRGNRQRFRGIQKNGNNNNNNNNLYRQHPTQVFMSSGWEDWAFQAESIASNMATFGLSAGGGTSASAMPSSVWWTSLPLLYGAGLLTSVSPCVWGLLPLTVSYISTAAGERSDGRTLLPTLAFAAGLASVFMSLGLVAALVGGAVLGSTGSVAAAFSGAREGVNAWNLATLLLSLLSYAVCLAMGLQLLELIQLPSFRSFSSSLSSSSSSLMMISPSESFVKTGRASDPSSSTSSSSASDVVLLDAKGNMFKAGGGSKKRNRGQIEDEKVHDDDDDEDEDDETGSLLRTFLLGGSSALVASPCATPVLTSILTYVAQARTSVFVGAALLGGYTLGYATPLLVVAATGGQALADLRGKGGDNGDGDDHWYGRIGPWVSPITGGILLWYGTDGLLTSVWGDPSMAGLAPMTL